MALDRETQDRPGRSSWPLALGAGIALLVVGFAFVKIRGVSQPEAASPSPVSGPAQSSIPSPTVEELPAAVLDTPAPTGPLAPDFTLPDLDGTMWSLSQFRGRPVVLFFWATW